MSLFKSQILDDYNLIMYQGDFLLLHCSKNDRVRAPFSGKVEVTEDGCVLYNDDFKLYINHMECNGNQKVSAGQTIGIPKMDRILGENKAYIGLKISYVDEPCDIILYLNYKDKDICMIKRSTEIEEEISEEMQETPKPKRKSNKKKETKNRDKS